jgi:hypothetical protein
MIRQATVRLPMYGAARHGRCSAQPCSPASTSTRPALSNSAGASWAVSAVGGRWDSHDPDVGPLRDQRSPVLVRGYVAPPRSRPRARTTRSWIETTPDPGANRSRADRGDVGLRLGGRLTWRGYRAGPLRAHGDRTASGDRTVTQRPPAARGGEGECSAVCLGDAIARPRPTPSWSARMRSVPRWNGSVSVETDRGVSLSPVFSTVSTAVLG